MTKINTSTSTTESAKTKALVKEKSLEGYFYENDKFRIETKYSRDAIRNEKLKIIIKEGNEVEFTAADLLHIIIENVKKKELALAMSESELEMKSIFMTTVLRTFNATLDRDMKAGEVLNINASIPYPSFLAELEQGYRLGMIDGDHVAVSFETLNKSRQKALEDNASLAEEINKPLLNKLKDIK